MLGLMSCRYSSHPESKTKIPKINYGKMAGFHASHVITYRPTCQEDQIIPTVYIYIYILLYPDNKIKKAINKLHFFTSQPKYQPVFLFSATSSHHILCGRCFHLSFVILVSCQFGITANTHKGPIIKTH